MWRAPLNPIAQFTRHCPDVVWSVEMLKGKRCVVARWTVNGEPRDLAVLSPTEREDAESRRALACQVLFNRRVS